MSFRRIFFDRLRNMECSLSARFPARRYFGGFFFSVRTVFKNRAMVNVRSALFHNVGIAIGNVFRFPLRTVLWFGFRYRCRYPLNRFFGAFERFRYGRNFRRGKSIPGGRNSSVCRSRRNFGRERNRTVRTETGDRLIFSVSRFSKQRGVVGSERTKHFFTNPGMALKRG